MLGQISLWAVFPLLLLLFWAGGSAGAAIRLRKMKRRGDAGSNFEVNTVLAASVGLLALLSSVHTVYCPHPGFSSNKRDSVRLLTEPGLSVLMAVAFGGTRRCSVV